MGEESRQHQEREEERVQQEEIPQEEGIFELVIPRGIATGIVFEAEKHKQWIESLEEQRRMRRERILRKLRKK